MKENKYCYEFPRPSLTVDALIFTFSENQLKLLLIERAHDPFAGSWAFPGGFVDQFERVESAVRRELKEETDLEVEHLSQLYVASAPDRDPRGWTVSVLFIGFVHTSKSSVNGNDDAVRAVWHPVNKLPALAFDHDHLVPKAIQYLRELARKSVLPAELLQPVFTIIELDDLYQQVMENTVEAQSLVGRLVQREIVYLDQDGAGFRFNEKRLADVQKRGF